MLNFSSGVTFGKHYGWPAGTDTPSKNRAYFQKVKVTPNDQYTVSADWKNTNWLNIYGFTNEGDTTAVARYGSASGTGKGSWDSKFAGGYTAANDMTFTVPDNVNYIGVSYASKSPDTLTLQGLLNGKPKLEQGSKVTPWMLFQQQKAMDTELKKEDGEITDVMEFVQYGLYLALFQDNIVKAKSDFSDFRSSFEFDTDGKGLKELVELWQKEI